VIIAPSASAFQTACQPPLPARPRLADPHGLLRLGEQSVHQPAMCLSVQTYGTWTRASRDSLRDGTFAISKPHRSFSTATARCISGEGAA
jgi:hypothetical protein